MSDAYQGPAIVADLHSREQHCFHRFQQSATFHTDSSNGDSQTVKELPGEYTIGEISVPFHTFVIFSITRIKRKILFQGKFKRR